MTMSAPSLRAKSSLAALEPTTNTRAPASLATRMLAVLTPPLAPTINTVSPGRRFPRVISECHAV